MADGAFAVAGLELGNPSLLNYETPHLGLRFYHIPKLICTIIILTTSYKFLRFWMRAALANDMI